MPSPSSILLFLSAALPVFATAQSCYSLEGTKLNSTFTPCAAASGAKHSGCCASTDICLDNGLCMATKNEYIGTIWQAGCTDPTGKDKACPQLCPTASNNFMDTDPVPAWNIQSCEVGTYCCRAPNDPQSCCTNTTAPRILTSSIGAFPVRVQSNAEATPSPSPSASATPLASSVPATCTNEKRSTAIVGGVLGALLGIALLGATAAIVWLHSKEQHQRRLKEHYEEQFAQTAAYRRAVAASSASIRRVETEEFSGKDTE